MLRNKLRMFFFTSIKIKTLAGYHILSHIPHTKYLAVILSSFSISLPEESSSLLTSDCLSSFVSYRSILSFSIESLSLPRKTSLGFTISFLPLHSWQIALTFHFVHVHGNKITLSSWATKRCNSIIPLIGHSSRLVIHLVVTNSSTRKYVNFLWSLLVRVF